VVGFLSGVRSLSGPYVICSLQTAREILNMDSSVETFILATCKDTAKVDRTLQDLATKFSNISVFSADEFSSRSQKYWLSKTKAGLICPIIFTILGPITALYLSGRLHASNQEWILKKSKPSGRTHVWVRLFARAILRSVFVCVTGAVLAFPLVLALTHWLRVWTSPGIVDTQKRV
jgi:putative ABC transport system permease protein